jgi:hypothetical protein
MKNRIVAHGAYDGVVGVDISVESEEANGLV